MNDLAFMQLHQAAAERDTDLKQVNPSPYRKNLLVLIEEGARQEDVRRHFADLSVWQLEALLRYEGITFPKAATPNRLGAITPERREELQALSLSD